MSSDSKMAGRICSDGTLSVEMSSGSAEAIETFTHSDPIAAVDDTWADPFSQALLRQGSELLEGSRSVTDRTQSVRRMVRTVSV